MSLEPAAAAPGRAPAASDQVERRIGQAAAVAAGVPTMPARTRIDRAALVGTLTLAAILVVGAWVRLWQVGAIGFNTDEAVYVGQAAAIANDPELKPFFPLFRAHPLLYQFLLAGVFALTGGVNDVVARLVSVAIGVLTVWLVFRLGRLLYGTVAGLIAALLVSVMPYHVVVTRQVLLDGPMTLFATLALYAVASYAVTRVPAWLYAAGASMGLTFLAKETGVVLFGAIYALFALAPSITVRVRDLALSVAAFLGVVAAFPLALLLAGGGGQTTAGQYLVWQLFRRPNHEADFYLATVPPAVGLLVIAVALAGLWLARHRLDWRERLLLAWIAVIVLFFQLWPVKGFPYLVAAAIPLAVLAGRGVVLLGRLPAQIGERLRGLRPDGAPAGPGTAAATAVIATIVALSLLVGTLSRIQPTATPELLAGAGGVPGGRDTGNWIRANTPIGAQLMTIGPSMANLIQFYGHRRAYGLSVSPNPLRRNPSYDPVNNPDLQIRSNDLQYAVWDAYSASRSPFFSAKLLDYVERYRGKVIYTETLPAADGSETAVIVVYEVRR
jgi:hypothetical protein